MAFQSTPLAIDFWRFLAGCGIGVELITVDTYLSELMPKDRRGQAFAFNQSFQFLAYPTVSLLALGLVPQMPFGWEGWRWVSGLLPAARLRSGGAAPGFAGIAAVASRSRQHC